MARTSDWGSGRARQQLRGGTMGWTLLLSLVALIWGASFIAVKYILKFVSPLELLSLRYVPVAFIFAVWLLPRQGHQVWRMVRAERWRIVVLGLTGAIINNTFLGWGLTHVAAGTASLVIALNPVFTYVLSVLALGERFLWRRAVGMALAFIGVFVIIRWGSGRAVTLNDVEYAFLIMLAPICWAVYTVLGKSVTERHPPLLVAGTSMIFAGAFSLAFVRPSLLAELPSLPALFWWAVLFMAVPSTIFALVVWFGALERLSAGRVASFAYLIPLFAVAFGHWLLGEPITAMLMLGAAVLVGGVWLVNRR